MCPACIGSALTLFAGASSAGVAACLAFWRLKVRRAKRASSEGCEHC